MHCKNCNIKNIMYLDWNIIYELVILIIVEESKRLCSKGWFISYIYLSCRQFFTLSMRMLISYWSKTFQRKRKPVLNCGTLVNGSVVIQLTSKFHPHTISVVDIARLIGELPLVGHSHLHRCHLRISAVREHFIFHGQELRSYYISK